MFRISEIFDKRLKDNIGKNIKIYLKNDFRFEGKLLGCDEKFIDIFDIKGEVQEVVCPARYPTTSLRPKFFAQPPVG